MTTIRVSDSLELVKILPYQLGYHPTLSLVAVGLRGRRLALVQRVDLPTKPASVVGVADVMVGQLRAQRCTAAVVVVFEEEAGDGEAAEGSTGDGRGTGEHLASRIRDAGIELTEHLVVRGGRVYFPDGPHTCSPDEGVLLPKDHDVAAVADFVALGASPCATRDGLAGRVAAADDAAARAVRAAARRLERGGLSGTVARQALAEWGRFLDTAHHPGPPEVPASAAAAARMAASLADVTVRDLLLAWLCPGTLRPDTFDPRLVALARAHWPGGLRPFTDASGTAPEAPQEAVDTASAQRSAALVDRLCWLARQTPRDVAPGVLTVLASYAWWLGDGALASTALDRALSIDPAYRLARLVEQMVSLAIRPPRPRVQAGLRQHPHRGFRIVPVRS